MSKITKLLNLNYINLFFCLTFFLLFSNQILAQSSREPSWVTQGQKKITGYYVGFGSAPKIGQSEKEFKQIANESAFLEISNQISVNIYGASKSILYEDENTSIDRAEFESQSSSIAELEGLELEEIYNSSDRYYVIWKLSKKEHEKNIDKYTRLAEEYFRSANTSIFNPVEELGYLVKGYESILRAHGKVISVESTEGNKVLNTFFPSRIEQIISKINTTAINYVQTGKKGSPLPAPLIFRAAYNELISQTLVGLPVRFVITEGEMKLEELKMTDSNGECFTTVTEIVSDLPLQKIAARIDLSSFKINSGKNVFLDRKLEEISSLRSETYAISVTALVAERIAVKILPQEGLPKGEDGFINEKFIAELKRLTEYTVIERAMMEEVLKENEFNAEECSTEECQVQIGKILAVRKMIYVLLWKYGAEYTGTIKLVNIESGENEHSESVSYTGSVTSLVKEGIPRWIRSFYSRLNTAKITLISGNRNIDVTANGLDWGKIPIFDKELDQGMYKVQFSALGYENSTRNYRVNLGDQINEDITLRSKTRGKALTRSLFFPGLGQFYSSDRDHGSRRFAGLIYSAGAIVCIAGTGYLWNEFSTANTDYDSAKKVYLQAIQLDNIDAMRVIMEDKHQALNDARSTAMAITGITVGLWLWNTIDAMLFFPKDYGMYSVAPRINTNGQETYATLMISKHF